MNQRLNELERELAKLRAELDLIDPQDGFFWWFRRLVGRSVLMLCGFLGNIVLMVIVAGFWYLLWNPNVANLVSSALHSYLGITYDSTSDVSWPVRTFVGYRLSGRGRFVPATTADWVQAVWNDIVLGIVQPLGVTDVVQWLQNVTTTFFWSHPLLVLIVVPYCVYAGGFVLMEPTGALYKRPNPWKYWSYGAFGAGLALLCCYFWWQLFWAKVLAATLVVGVLSALLLLNK